MKKNKVLMPIIIGIIGIVIVLLFATKNEKPTIYDKINKAYVVSVDTFKEANIDLNITSTSNYPLYTKVTEIERKDPLSDYKITITQLSPDFLSDKLYETTTQEGVIAEGQEKSLFPGILKISSKKVSKFRYLPSSNVEETIVEFVVKKENINKVFVLEDSEIDDITEDGIKVEVTMIDNKVKEYCYEYNTIDGTFISIDIDFVLELKE